MIRGLSGEEHRDLVLSVGTHKAKRLLTPTEVATYFERALDAGVSRDELAKACLLESTTIIGRFLKLLKLAPKFHHLVVFGSGRGSSLSFSQAMEIGGLVRVSDQEELISLTMKYGLSKKEVAAVRQKTERAGVSVTEAADDILALRPSVTEVFVFVGIIRDVAVHNFLDELLQVDRDALLASLLEEAGFPGDGHLSTRRFSIATDDPSYGNFDVEGFQEAVNEQLGRLAQ